MKELTEEIKKQCNCIECDKRNECPHRESHRRYPVEFGGTGACKNLKKGV